MTKSEYISTLSRELKRLGVQDSGDVIEEYEQHFEFKCADGCTEEEVAARLGSPAALAAQFAQPGRAQGGGLAVVGLGFAWVFASLLFALLAAWAVVMAVFTLACAVCAVCLAVGADLGGIIPNMPYLCAVIYAVTFAALAALSAVGTLYYSAFVRQLIRALTRFSHNTMAAARGQAALPVAPRFAPAKTRELRRIALVSLAIFAAGFVLAAVLSMIFAGSLEFWHAWNWFGYTA